MYAAFVCNDTKIIQKTHENDVENTPEELQNVACSNRILTRQSDLDMVSKVKIIVQQSTSNSSKILMWRITM